MHTCKVKLTGTTPYSQGKHYETAKLARELPRDYEERTWRDRMHTDEKDMVFIPLTSLKNCLADTAKYLAMPIPGKGKSTYTKHIEAGLIVQDHIPLGIKKSKAESEWVFVPSDGQRGGKKRVWKCFPIFKTWSGETTIIILDDIVTQEVLDAHLKAAGAFVGLGRFRPRNNGYYGRFKAEILSWE